MSDLHMWSFECDDDDGWRALVVAPTEAEAFRALVAGGHMSERVLDAAGDHFITHRLTREELESLTQEGPERDALLSDLLDEARRSGAEPFVLVTSESEWEVVSC